MRAKKAVTCTVVAACLLFTPQYTEANNNVLTAKPVAVVESAPVAEVQAVEAPQITRHEMSLPSQSSGKFKTYMGYKAIKNKKSQQYKMQQEAYTNENGFRIYDDCYMVALGTYYATSCGEKFVITLESGAEIKVITGDIKADKHTNSTNQYIEHNGNIVEFIVDTKKIPKICKTMGDMSYAGLRGDIIKIERLSK